MTIAVSAVVKPSKLLQRSVCISCLLALCLAALIGMGKVGELSARLRWALVLTLSLSAAFAFFYVFLSRKTFRIDISGIGQIRLTDDSGIGDASRQQGKQEKQNSTQVVQLANDSTIWPHLLLLRLRAENRRRCTLVILPDCMDSQTFRRLAVACRWIAAHNVHHAYTKEWGAKE